jgi:hypothetical protein
MLKKGKDKLPNQCPYCESFNTTSAYCGELPNLMFCDDCDSSWFEYANEWVDIVQRGKVINEDTNK